MRSRLSQLRLPQLVLILIAAGSADQPPRLTHVQRVWKVPSLVELVLRPAQCVLCLSSLGNRNGASSSARRPASLALL